MRSFWSEPFLWIHLAGIASLPLWLEVCLLGLAVGDPLLPIWLELLFLAVVGITPVLWMQLIRPFNIFSIVAVALKPEQLTPVQRRILRLFKTPLHQVLTVVAAILMVGVLWQVYWVSPIAVAVTPFPSEWRVAGLLVAGVAFLASNLFLQVPVSVIAVLLTSESAFATTEPYPLEKISQDFTLPGLQVNQILPLIVEETAPTSVPVSSDDPASTSSS